MRRKFLSLALVALCVALTACERTSADKINSPIVGTWFVKIPEAPFPYHMLTFHSDGTALQSNPDAGNANTSDSNGLGVWVQDGEGVRGKFVELTADRSTHKFVSRGELSFQLKVNGNVLSGTLTALFYDAEGRRLKTIAATMSGQRVLP